MEIEVTSELLKRGYGPGELARLTRQGTLVRLRRGAYVWGAAEDEERAAVVQRIRATMLQCHRDGVLSHQSAAALHGLPLWADHPSRIQLIRPGTRGKIRQHAQIRTAALGVEELDEVEGMPVTSVARTVIDLARTTSEQRGVAVGDAALRDKLTSTAALATALAGAIRRPGIGRARRVVAFLDPRSQSVGESASRVVLRRLGVPAPVLQREVRNHRGELIGTTDFCWEDEATLGEFDGKIKYGRLLQPGQSISEVLYAEKLREDALRDQGWQVVRWCWDDLRRPRALADRLQRAFARSARTIRPAA